VTGSRIVEAVEVGSIRGLVVFGGVSRQVVHRVLDLTQLPRNANYIFEPFNIGGEVFFLK